jgi:hypothetical protein
MTRNSHTAAVRSLSGGSAQTYAPGSARPLSGDAFQARALAVPVEPRVAPRLAGFATSIAIAALSLAACNKNDAEPDSQFTFHYQGNYLWLVSDNRTTCEYLYTSNGGITLRSDAYGNVTPNCAGSHGYAKDFPYGERPDQQVKEARQ